MVDFALNTGVPGVDLALGIAARVYACYQKLSRNYDDAKHTLNHLGGVVDIVRQIASAGLADRLQAQVADVCVALDAAEDAANASLPLAAKGGSTWLDGVFNGTKRFVFSGSIGQALHHVNVRLDRAVQLLQASLAVDTKKDTKELREAQARLEHLEREQLAATARIERQQRDASARIEEQLKALQLAGVASGAAQQHVARRIEWSDIKFDHDEDGDLVVLGAGSFGTVYAAKWCDEPVAVKSMIVKGMGPKVIRDFWREADLQARLNSHELIVSCLGAAEKKKAGEIVEVAIVVARMSGETLDHWHAASTPPPLATRVKAIIEVATALRFMHAQEIIHGDIKPANIMLDGYGRARIADLGTARSFHAGDADASTMKRAIGTPRYMDPAFVKGGCLTPASDVYSFAVLVWEVLANIIPFGGYEGGEDGVVKLAAAGARPDVSILPRELAQAVAAFLPRAWHEDQSTRPTMAQLVKELEAIKLGGGSAGGDVRAAVPASATVVPASAQTPRARALEVLDDMKKKHSKDFRAIVGYLHDFADDVSVCEKVILTMWSCLWWCIDDDDDEVAVIEALVPAAIVAAMHRHTDSNLKVAEYGCRILEKVATIKGGKKAAVDALAPAAIVAAMRKHADVNADVAHHGCRAIMRIAILDAGQAAAVDALAPAAIIAAMRKHADSNFEVAQYGCWALTNIARDFDAGMKACNEAGFKQAVLRALNAHPSIEKEAVNGFKGDGDEEVAAGAGGAVEVKAEGEDAKKKEKTPASAALPDGWEEKFSNSKQKTYYHNKGTGETVWERPHEAAAAAKTVLPAGWVAKFSNSKQKVFYYNNSTGVTAWDLPTSPKTQTAAASPLPNGDSSGKAPSAAALPPGWVAQFSNSKQKTFYYNKATGETAWDIPHGAATP